MYIYEEKNSSIKRERERIRQTETEGKKNHTKRNLFGLYVERQPYKSTERKNENVPSNKVQAVETKKQKVTVALLFSEKTRPQVHVTIFYIQVLDSLFVYSSICMCGCSRACFHCVHVQNGFLCICFSLSFSFSLFLPLSFFLSHLCLSNTQICEKWSIIFAPELFAP